MMNQSRQNNITRHLERNPQLRAILFGSNDRPRFGQNELHYFVDGKVTDVLLPFPTDGRGLPARLSADSKENFLKYQKDILCEREDIFDVSGDQEQSTVPHHAVDDGVVAAHYGDHNALGKGGYASVSAVQNRVHNSPAQNQDPFALKCINRPGTAAGPRWDDIDRIAADGQYPDSHQKSFQLERAALEDLQQRPTAEERFQAVRHSHIIKLNATFTDPDAFYLLLSPVALCNLNDLLHFCQEGKTSSLWTSSYRKLFQSPAKQRQQVGDCLRKSFGCLSAIVLYLHRQAEMRHRDLKPQNILVVYDARSMTTKICLCDFATALEPSKNGGTFETPGKQRVESPHYTSPERVRAHPQSLPDDMYTLGLVFLEIYAALLNEPLDELLMLGHEIGEDHYEDNEECAESDRVPIKGHCIPQRDVHKWLDRITSRATSSNETDLAAVGWIKGLLLRDPTKRFDSVALARKFRNDTHSQGDRFWGHCCSDFYRDTGNLVQTVRADPCIFRKTVTQAVFQTRPGKRESTKDTAWHDKSGTHADNVDDGDSTIAVLQTDRLERRLLLARNSSWPEGDFKVDAWLPVTNLSIEEDGNNVVLEWPHFDSVRYVETGNFHRYYWLGPDPTWPNRRLSICFSSPTDAEDFRTSLNPTKQPRSECIHLSDTHYIVPARLEGQTLVDLYRPPNIRNTNREDEDDYESEPDEGPGFASCFISARNQRNLRAGAQAERTPGSEMHTVYLVRKSLRPLGLTLKEGLRLCISGLESVAYEATGRLNGPPEVETACGIQKRRCVDCDLDIDLGLGTFTSLEDEPKISIINEGGGLGAAGASGILNQGAGFMVNRSDSAELACDFTISHYHKCAGLDIAYLTRTADGDQRNSTSTESGDVSPQEIESSTQEGDNPQLVRFRIIFRGADVSRVASFSQPTTFNAVFATMYIVGRGLYTAPPDYLSSRQARPPPSRPCLACAVFVAALLWSHALKNQRRRHPQGQCHEPEKTLPRRNNTHALQDQICSPGSHEAVRGTWQFKQQQTLQLEAGRLEKEKEEEQQHKKCEIERHRPEGGIQGFHLGPNRDPQNTGERTAESGVAGAEKLPSVSVTLRLRNLPATVTEQELSSALARVWPEADDSNSAGTGSHILRLSLIRSTEAQGLAHKLTATVCLAQPRPPLDVYLTKVAGFYEGELRLGFAGSDHDITVDNHFYGLTPLYSHANRDIELVTWFEPNIPLMLTLQSIVAVTGWHGKAFWSWKPADAGHMWLRDWLGPDLADRKCRARIYTYGYPSQVAASDSDASVRDYGQTLLNYLATTRSADVKAGHSRPLVFIGHSLGGLVIKQALKDAAQSVKAAEKNIAQSLLGSIMFGVPNLGMHNKSLIPMTEGRPNETFARSLGVESHYLPMLDEDFFIHFTQKKVPLVAIYETLDSPSVINRARKSNRHLGVPSCLEKNFLGRDSILTEMDHCLMSDKGPQVFVLVGTGGMGKTQIALKHISLRSDKYSRVLWVRSDTEQNLEESFHGFAVALGLSHHGDYTHRVLRHLESIGQRFLLVYDNLDDATLAQNIGNHHRDLWPTDCRVIITTRNREYLAFQTDHSPVEPLQDPDARMLLGRLLAGGMASSSRKSLTLDAICSSLGNLPLGIQQAGAYMNYSGIDPSKYLNQLRSDPGRTLKYVGEWWPYKLTLLEAWETSLAQVGERTYAREWFLLGCVFDKRIPGRTFELPYRHLSRQTSVCDDDLREQIDWLYSASDSSAWTVSLLRNQLLQLTGLSLVKAHEEEEGTSFDFYPLVQEWARLRTTSEENRHHLIQAAILLYYCLNEIADDVQSEQDKSTAFINQRWLLPHVHSCIEFSRRYLGINIAEVIPLRCASAFAMLLIHENKYATAQSMLEKALLKEPHIQTQELAARRVLALALRRQDKLEAALEIQQAVVQEMELKPSFPSPPLADVLHAQEELSTTYRDLKRYDIAYDIQAEVVRRSETHFGINHLRSLHAQACLATTLSRSRRYAEAAAIEKRILDIYEAIYPHRPEIFTKKRNLAMSYYNLDRYHDAAELECDVLHGVRDLYGGDHLETAAAMHNLGATYFELGHMREARSNLSKALEIRRQALGDSHRRTRKTAELFARAELHGVTYPSPKELTFPQGDSGIG
ncbi:hypothetical protein SUNI508_04675 [Seiridium unicorne]|uniref:Protein kinase domain-containing protein n=1 Tax=Seiridium unicorne TaxID=138068 RepID=A0ABR2V7X2_9PEZI